MGILDGRKVQKAITQLTSGGSIDAVDVTQASLTLRKYVDIAIPKLIEALDVPKPSIHIVNLLATLLESSTLPRYFDGLAHNKPQVSNTIASLLSTPGKFNPSLLFELYEDPRIKKPVLSKILVAHKDKLKLVGLLRLLRLPNKEIKASVLRLLDEIASETNLHEYMGLAESDDPAVKVAVLRTLSRFHTEGVRGIYEKLLKDRNKAVRQAALEGLGKIKVPIDIGPICEVLRDPDITVQAKAIETLIAINDPGSVNHILEILQDESEYVRRAAVEVLNEVGDVNAIKDLMRALRDKDWWVRVRAADAMGRIGGPKVVEAVLSMIKDEDEFIRRFAVEILNTTSDERAFDYLLEAIEDPDWWVRERAVDALVAIGNKDAVPAFIKMLENDPEARSVVLKALTQIGDERAIPAVTRKLESSDMGIRKEALHALAALTTDEHFENVKKAVERIEGMSDPDLKAAADETMIAIMDRVGDATRIVQKSDVSVLQPDKEDDQSIESSLPSSDRAVKGGVGGAAAVSGAESDQGYIDAKALKVGEVIANRYRVIRHVGRGAFGDVILVEDEVVNEEIILKFLHPNLLSDENVIKRFVHELRYARKITHENVIRIFDFLTIGKSYAMSMEYFDSHSLSVELKKKGFVDRARAFKVILDITKAINVAHQVDVVHRDIKPGNILLNEVGLLKVCDFGLAAAASTTDGRLTKTGMILGTPTYMAPEQVRDGEIEPRTDIYSLGVLMYEIFSGRPPYTGKDPMAILFQHIEGKPTPPNEVNPELSQELSDCILKAMALLPEDRFASMVDLGEDLNAIQTKEMG